MARTKKRAPSQYNKASITVGATDDAALAKPASVAASGGRRSLRLSSANGITSRRESVSSATPPSESLVSGSGYSTPLTSIAPTPAGEKLQINIPVKPVPADSVQSLNKSKYNINRKRKRYDDDDSDEDDLSDYDSPDLKLARRLQQEEDAKVGLGRASTLTSAKKPLIGLPRKSLTAKGKAPASAVKGKAPASAAKGKALASDAKGKAPASRYGNRAPRRAATNASQVDAQDSDSDDYSVLDPKVLFGSDSELSSIESEHADRGADLSDSEESVFVFGSDSDLDPEEIDGMPADSDEDSEQPTAAAARVKTPAARLPRPRRQRKRYRGLTREERDRALLEDSHPEMKTLWTDFEARPVPTPKKAEQPKTISRLLKPFQLEGLAWMKDMEKTEWKGGLLGDEMGLGKTIQAVSLIMSDWPVKKPSLVLAPPVALMQWMSEIQSYTDGNLKTMVFHGTNAKSKNMKLADLRKLDVIIMSYNSLESMYRKQEKGFKRKDGLYKEESLFHRLEFHRVILDEAHYIKSRTTMTSKACFALKTDYRWCLTGTPLQNRIGEFFSLIRFLKIEPFANYLCRDCPCSSLEWQLDDTYKCKECKHGGLRHVSVFNQELLNPIQRYGNTFLGAEAFKKLRLLTSRIMLRRQKKDHMDAMELPVKEVVIDRQFFGEEELDFADSIMHSNQRRFDTYVSQGVMLNNYANIFGLLMQMRQVADHPDLILKKGTEGGQNVLVCCICDDAAEDAIRSQCHHEFCRACASSYLGSTDQPTCPHCHIALSIDLEQPEIEQDQELVKKNSIINRIRMEQWTSSTKIEMLVYQLQKLRSDHATHKSIIFSQFTSMLQLIEWRLRRAGITTVMLDGSMTPAQRAASIDHFMNNIDVECFLVSLKAGGVALNLTEASRVFIVDPWWNPAAEWQSADRCHRIGQTRPCIITRLCIEDSIESRIVQLQEKKTKMINSTVDADGAALDSLDPEDLQFLFRGN